LIFFRSLTNSFIAQPPESLLSILRKDAYWQLFRSNSLTYSPAEP
jgi:hypothetical protein